MPGRLVRTGIRFTARTATYPVTIFCVNVFAIYEMLPGGVCSAFEAVSLAAGCPGSCKRPSGAVPVPSESRPGPWPIIRSRLTGSGCADGGDGFHEPVAFELAEDVLDGLRRVRPGVRDLPDRCRDRSHVDPDLFPHEGIG